MVRDGVPVSPEVAALVCRYCEGEQLNVRAELLALVPPLSKSAFYRYVARFRDDGVDGLYPRSRRPLTSPTSIASVVEDAVVLARKELADAGWVAGADQILFWLTDHADRWRPPESAGAALPSRASVNRILKRRGLMASMPQRAPRKPKRFERDQPNTLWQMDGFDAPMAGGRKATVLHIVDDCSRVDIALDAVASENAADVWACVTKAAGVFGLPRMMLTDNGSAFSGRRRGWTSPLEENLAELGVRHITSSVAHPQTCGKCERAHQPVLRWLAKQPVPENLAQLQALLNRYRRTNNQQRRRRHLDGLTPMERYRLGPKDGPGTAPIPLPVEITQHKVAANGSIGVDSNQRGIGKTHAGKTVQVVRQGTKVVIIDGHHHLASFILNGRKRYQSVNPQRPGRPPGKLSPKS